MHSVDMNHYLNAISDYFKIKINVVGDRHACYTSPNFFLSQQW